jgi:hypothetical protein
MKMRRLTAPLLALLTASALAPLPTSAATPTTSPPEPLSDEFVIPAGDACDFDLAVTATGKLGAILFADGRGIYTAPGLKMTFHRHALTAADAHGLEAERAVEGCRPLMSVPVMRAPVMPNGWPTAIEPPWG